MIYCILIVVGALGIAGTLWTSHPRFQMQDVPEGDAWYVLHPENFESGIVQRIRAIARGILKVTLIWMIAAYRKLSERITVKQTLKRKIRGFLYEHSNDGARHPSEFWNKVRSTPGTKPRKPRHVPHAEPPTSTTPDDVAQ